MKPTKKKTAKIYIALILILAVVGTLFAFVPMNFGNTSFTSLLGTINISADLSDGMYAEYDIEGESSTEQINSSIQKIKDVLVDEGFASTDVFAINNKKLRVEIGYPRTLSAISEAYSVLNSVGVGSFELRSSSSEDDTFIVGNKHIKNVSIKSSGGSTLAVLEFNEAGVEAYEALLDASDTIYVYMGGTVVTNFDSSSSVASSEMYLTMNDYPSAQSFVKSVKLGCLDITLNNKTTIVDTMENVGSKQMRIAGLLAIVFVVVLGFAYMLIRHGVLGLFQALAMLFNSIFAVILLWAFPWVELSFSSLIAIALGYAILVASSLIFCSRFREEYDQGKTVAASFESSYKKSLSSVLAIGIALTIIFGVILLVLVAVFIWFLPKIWALF